MKHLVSVSNKVDKNKFGTQTKVAVTYITYSYYYWFFNKYMLY